jgi:hypothetical protein
MIRSWPVSSSMNPASPVATQPSASLVRRCLGVLVVFHEGAGRAVVDLAVLADPHLHARRRHAHRIGAHLAIGLLGDEDAGLGLAVELLEVDPERAPEIEDLRPDRLARGIGHAHGDMPARLRTGP